MKMIYGGVPVNSLKVKHYEMDTNDCDMIASDLQAGKTAVARGQKIIGTGKSFEFASYGELETNVPDYAPVSINIIEIASLEYPIRSSYALNDMKDIDFSTEQTIGFATIDGVEYPITAKVEGVLITLGCEKTIALEIFYGRDRYA